MQEIGKSRKLEKKNIRNRRKLEKGGNWKKVGNLNKAKNLKIRKKIRHTGDINIFADALKRKLKKVEIWKKQEI